MEWGTFSKNVNVTTIMFFMSGDLTGLCLYIIGDFNFKHKTEDRKAQIGT